MALMNLDDLMNYDNWVGKTPSEVLQAVKAVAVGWHRVFPLWKGPLPKWAHRVRNYFNEEPHVLYRWRHGREAAHVKSILDKLDVNILYQEDWALSGQVYYDSYGRTWLQMSAAATIYHYPDGILSGKAKAFHNTTQGQSTVPVIKLVSPDGTGGSRECIIKSRPYFSALGKTYEAALALEQEYRVVVTSIETARKYQGSYNYSETVEQGLIDHEFHDVTPHNKDATGYVDPPRFSVLEARRFPKFDNSGNELAKLSWV